MALNPNLSAPTHDLDELYSWANARYFNNQLPSNTLTKWNNRFSDRAGDMSPFGITHNPQFTIRISESIRNNEEALLNVLVHEQIHIWQSLMAIQTGNKKYLDEKRNRFLDKSRIGHSIYFQKKMNELNDRFEELNVDITLDSRVGGDNHLPSSVHGFIVEIDADGNNYQAVFRFTSDIQQITEDLIQDIKGVYGNQNVIAITPLLTHLAIINQCEKVTKSGRLSKRQKMAYHKDEVSRNILNDDSTIIKKGFEFTRAEFQSDIPRDIQLFVASLKNCYGRGFAEFVNTAFLNCKSLQSLKGPGITINTLISKERPDLLTPNIQEYLYDLWQGATGKEIAKDKHFKTMSQSIARSIYFKRSLPELQREVKELMNYCGHFRFKKDEFKKSIIAIGQSNATRKKYSTTPEAILEQLNKLNYDPVDTSSIASILNEINPSVSQSNDSFRQQVKANMINNNIEFNVSIDEILNYAWENPTEEQIISSGTGFLAFKKMAKLIKNNPSEVIVPDATIKSIEGYFENFESRMKYSDFVTRISTSLKSKVSRDMQKEFGCNDYSDQLIEKLSNSLDKITQKLTGSSQYSEEPSREYS